MRADGGWAWLGVRAVLFGVAFIVGAELGHLVSMPGRGFATFWPPTGLYAATLALTAPAAWPIFAAVALMANLASDVGLHGQPAALVLGFWSASTLGSVWIATMLRRAGGPSLAKVAGVGRLVASAMIGTMASALVGTASLVLVRGLEVTPTFRIYWAGDLMGVLVVAPILLAPATRSAAGTRKEGAFLAALLVAMAWMVFDRPYGPRASVLGYTFILFPPLAWMAIRAGARGSAIGTLGLAAVAAWSTAHGEGPFGGGDPADRATQLQVFLAVVVGMSLLVAAVMAERVEAESALRGSRNVLESRVRARTLELERAVGELEREVEERRRAERRRAETEARMLDLAESVPQMVWATDFAGRAEYFNSRWFDYTGATPAQSEGSGWVNFVHPEDADRARARWTDAVRDGVPYEVEYRLRRADGAHRWVLARGLPRRDARGRLIGWFGTCTDVDDRKRIERDLRHARDAMEARVRERTAELEAVVATLEREVEERRRAEALARERRQFAEGVAEANPSILYVIDLPEGRLTWANRRVGEVLGREPAAMLAIGRSFARRLLHPDDAGRLLAADPRHLFDDLADGEVREEEFRARHADGSWRWLRSRMLVFARDEAGRPSQVLGAAIDVTDRKSAEDTLRVLFERSSDAHLIFDEQSGIIDCNPAALAMLRCPNRAAVLGLHPAALSPEFQPDGRRSSLKCVEMDEIARREGSHRFDWLHRRLDGEVFPCEVSLTPVELGGRSALLVVWHELTERQRAEQAVRESEEQLRTLLDAAVDAIITIDDRGIIQTVNPAACRMFGREAAAVTGRNVALLMPEPYAAEHDANISARAHGTDGKVLGIGRELIGMRADGSTFPIELSLSEFRLAGRRYFTGIARDVGPRREAEEALRRAKEAAEAATRAKGEFLANMSHEIRTPMNGVLGLADLALDSADESVRREYLGLIKASAESLLTVIDDVLDFSRIEAGKLAIRPEPLDVRTLAEDVTRLMAVRAHGKGLRLAWRVGAQVPSRVLGDAVRIRQVLVNLLGNAVKFTERGEVDLEVDSAGPAGLEFRVRDTGIGIEPGALARVFEPFEQADASTTRRFGGSGLGLAICGRLVGLMGGRIEAESRPGHGSTFRFTLPAPAVEAEAMEAAETPLAGVRALIVDGHEVSRSHLAEALESAGASTTSAGRAATALEALREGARSGSPYRLALIDDRLPGPGGRELARQVRADPDLAATSLVLLTAEAIPPPAGRVVARGFATALGKPVRPAELVEVVRRLIEAPSLDVPPPAPVVLPASLRVLLVEDNEVNQIVAARLLERLDHEVTVVSDGLAAVERTDSERFDAVLMDVQMPIMDGFEATAAIRSREASRDGHLPIFALTAHAVAGYREHCLASGFDGYLTKPIRLRDLEEALRGIAPAARDDDGPCPSGGSTVDGLREICGGEEPFMREMAESFLETAPRCLADVDEAMAAGDVEALARAVHGLRGTSLSVGAAALADRCRDLKTPDPAAAARLHAAWSEASRELESYLESTRCAS